MGAVAPLTPKRLNFVSSGKERAMNARTLVIALLLAVLGACTRGEHQVESAKRAVSPLIGTWEINADVAGKNPREGYPQFTALRFEVGGTLFASYAAHPTGLGAVTGGAATTKNETDHWSVSGGRTLRIVEGSRELSYAFEVRDRELLLTPRGTDTAVVYARKSGASEP